MKLSIKKTIFVGVLAGLLVAIIWVNQSYRTDIQTARLHLSEGSTIVETSCGSIEYAERGTGPPVLIIHGAGGGYDQGLLLGGFLVGDGYRHIAPSRFGYLSPVPEDNSVAAQAAAYECLLDALSIDKVVVVAFSAGGTSGLTFVHKYPKRVSVFVLGSAVSFTDNTDEAEAKRVSGINRIIANDFVYWSFSKIAWRQMGALFGVTNEFQKTLSPEEMETMRSILEQMTPLSLRLDGVTNDQSQVFPKSYPLKEISKPTLVVHAEDDTLVLPFYARHSADEILGAKLVMLPNGGHFLLGQHDAAREIVRNWLSENGIVPEEKN
jgi:pimeloyl-ACP methyl ester carboxylesterase